MRAFAGRFYDAARTANWDAIPPDEPPLAVSLAFDREGPYVPVFSSFNVPNEIDPDLKAPRSDQYTVGLESRIPLGLELGLQMIYKDTEDLIGWEILGDGTYQLVSTINPLTGEAMEFANVLESPTVRKGNRPGDGSLAPPGISYEQTYRAAIFTLARMPTKGRFRFQSSYTWSRTTGLSTHPFSQTEGRTQAFNRIGTDPNHFINADQTLVSDREHTVQVQGLFRLPLGLVASIVGHYSDGRPYSRQLPVNLTQGLVWFTAQAPSDDNRLPANKFLDLSIGRVFRFDRATLRFDLQALNVTNQDFHQSWATTRVPLGTELTPAQWIRPRRFMLRLGVRF